MARVSVLQRPTKQDFLNCFPRHGKFRKGLRPVQKEIIEAIADGATIIEAPTGIGKSPLEYMVLRAELRRTENPVFWITPTKALVDQFKKDFPDVNEIYGSSECPCIFAAEGFDPKTSEPVPPERLLELYYDPNVPRRDAVPCITLDQCPHRVDLETGQTVGEGAIRCPFYEQLYRARRGGIVLCTMSFYLFSRLFGRHFPMPSALVIDEAHRLGDVLRYSLSFDISDWHLLQLRELLERIEAEEAVVLKKFRDQIRRISKARRRGPYEEHLLAEAEIRRLLETLEEIDEKQLENKIKQAVRARIIHPREDYALLKRLETLVRDIRRYVSSLTYALEDKTRKPLNYVCAFWRKEKDEQEKVQIKLTVHAHYVGPLIYKCLLAPLTVAFSATIGDAGKFSFDTGIKGTFVTFPSPFPITRTRLYLPTDTWDLRYSAPGSQRNKTRTLRQIARACRRFADQGHRSLVVVISNEEREKFIKIGEEEGLEVISYGNAVTPKNAALVFRGQDGQKGEGDVLVGTAANYAEGLDLPRQIAPVIFFLRPGFPNPRSALAQFEERRWTRAKVEGMRRWRVLIQALQVRGRNVRGPRDLGVTFFCSQQFKPILRGKIPEWMKPALCLRMTWEEALRDAEALLAWRK